MNILLYPRASESPVAVRVWLAVVVDDVLQQGAWSMEWTLDGHSAQPVGILRSVLDADMTAPSQRRVYTGVFEFTQAEAGRKYAVEVVVHDGDKRRSAACVSSTRPETLSALSQDRWFSILLVSCFSWHSYAGGSLLTRLASTLRSAEYQPDLTVFMGDQVYLDLPTFQNFPDDLPWLAAKFQDDYVRNWTPSAANDYATLMSLAPSVFMPDDHEFWNNYPFASPFIGNTHSAEGRERWERAARALVQGFQAYDTAAPGMPVRIDIPPLSLFIADTRTDRQTDFSQLMQPAAVERLNTWADDVASKGYIGVFVSGQSLFSPPKGAIGGSVADYELSNYSAGWRAFSNKRAARSKGDYDAIIAALQRIVRSSAAGKRGGTALCLTGDVHWGRMLRVLDSMNNRRPLLHEIITSPVALVATPGSDQLKLAGNFFGGLLGKSKPFPRHSEAETPDQVYIAGSVAGQYAEVDVVHGQVGDQVALLSFRARGNYVDTRLSYFPLTADNRVYNAHRWEKVFEKFGA